MEVIQLMKLIMKLGGDLELALTSLEMIEKTYRFRELSLVRTKLEEAEMWNKKLIDLLSESND